MDEVISGTVAGMTQVAVGHPLDTTKVRFVSGDYSNLRKCVIDINRGGVRSFYRGIFSPLLGSVFANVQTFYMYDKCKNITNSPLIAGSITGFGLSVIETPVELIKSRMQISSMTYGECVRQAGFRGLTTGFGITALRNGLGVGMMFWGYENTRAQFPNSPLVGSFIGGIAAGALVWGPVYPIDHIKTRIQTDGLAGLPRKSAWTMAKEIGFKRSWGGFIPCFVRAVVVNPFIFLAYELSKNWLS